MSRLKDVAVALSDGMLPVIVALVVAVAGETAVDEKVMMPGVVPVFTWPPVAFQPCTRPPSEVESRPSVSKWNEPLRV